MAIIAIQRYRSVCSLKFEPSTKRTARVSINGYECQLSPSKVASRVSRWCSAVTRLFSCSFLCPLRPSKGPQIYSMRPIFISILITWLLSAFISTLFTYSTIVVARPSIVAEIRQHVYQTMLAKARNSNSTLDTSRQNNIEFNMEPDPDHLIVRCQNPVPIRVEQFLANYSINSELAKTIVVFATQYFIPLTIACVLYIRIGKIITKQGKLATVRGNNE